MESVISVQMVHGGFILTTPETLDKFGIQNASMSGNYKTEVFTSQGKLMKALRASIEANSLLTKPKEEEADEPGLLEKAKQAVSKLAD